MMELIVTSSVLILVIAALRLCLRGRICARLQYALWGLVVLRLLLPFPLFESPVSVMKLLPQTPAATERHVPPAAPPVRSDAPASPVGQTPTAPSVQPRGALGRLAVGIWLGGAFLCGLVFLAANLRMSRRLRRCRVPLEHHGCKIAVYTATGLPSPCLYGLWKPSVYLTPESTADTIRLTHILTHEETHYRHGDHLWALSRAVCVCLHWYNPLVWLAAVLSRRDSELACDESALKRLGDAQRIAYGKTLIEMVTAPAKPSDLLCCATTMSGSKGELAERLRRIAKKPRLLVTAVLLALLMSVSAVAVTFGSAPNTEAPAANRSQAEQLWDARTAYVGDAPSVGKLIGLLPIPQGLRYDHFELGTTERPYSLTVYFQTDKANRDFYALANRNAPLQRNALTLFALIENVDTVIFTLDDGQVPFSLDYRRDWADTVAGGDVRDFAKSHEQVAQLMEFPLELPLSDQKFFDEAMRIVRSKYPEPLIIDANGYHSIAGNADGYTFQISDPAAQENGTGAASSPVHMVGIVKSTGEIWDYSTDTGEWVKQPHNVLKINTAQPTYRVTRYGKGGEVMSMASLTDETLIQKILMDTLSKSAAWQGVDIATLEEYYLIEEHLPSSGETRRRYVYLLEDSRPVLQWEENGIYSILSQALYDELDSIYAKAMHRTTDVLHNLSTDGAVTLNRAKLPAYSWKTNSEKIGVTVSGAANPVVVELYDTDSRSELLMRFTLDANKTSGTFTNLTSAKNYWIWTTGDSGISLTISD